MTILFFMLLSWMVFIVVPMLKFAIVGGKNGVTESYSFKPLADNDWKSSIVALRFMINCQNLTQQIFHLPSLLFADLLAAVRVSVLDYLKKKKKVKVEYYRIPNSVCLPCLSDI